MRVKANKKFFEATPQKTKGAFSLVYHQGLSGDPVKATLRVAEKKGTWTIKGKDFGEESGSIDDRSLFFVLEPSGSVDHMRVVQWDKMKEIGE